MTFLKVWASRFCNQPKVFLAVALGCLLASMPASAAGASRQDFAAGEAFVGRHVEIAGEAGAVGARETADVNNPGAASPGQVLPAGQPAEATRPTDSQRQDDQGACPSRVLKKATAAEWSVDRERHSRQSQLRSEWERRRHEARKSLRGNAPCLAWLDPEKASRAVILCVHGLGLYNGSYEEFGRRMRDLGFAVYAIDVRGFGSWMQAQGRQKVNFDACLADLESTLKVIRRAHPGLPVFLLGESMGGALGLRATAYFPELIDGLISSVPGGERFKQKRTALKVALHLLKDPDAPFDVGSGVIKQATADKGLRHQLGSDPLNKLNLSAKELLQFQAFMNKNHDAARQINSTAVLIVQGCRDRLVKLEGTVELYEALATADKELVLIPSAEHLIFEEGQFRDEDIELVCRWIDAHRWAGRTEKATSQSGENEDLKR